MEDQSTEISMTTSMLEQYKTTDKLFNADDKVYEPTVYTIPYKNGGRKKRFRWFVAGALIGLCLLCSITSIMLTVSPSSDVRRLVSTLKETQQQLSSAKEQLTDMKIELENINIKIQGKEEVQSKEHNITKTRKYLTKILL